MKKLLIAAILAAAWGYVYAQAPAAGTQAAPAPTTEAKAAPAAGIKVEKIVTASSIENKEPVNGTSAFDKSVGKVYTWTKVTAAATPAKIKHVYYWNDKKEREIELTIGGSPWRVWSAKNVRPGNWKVEVTDEASAVLTTTAFTVAETPAEAPKTETPAPGK